MALICHACHNNRYFTVEVETLRALKSNAKHTVVEDAMFEKHNYSESMLRENLRDIVHYVLQQNGVVLRQNLDGEYVNNYISCAKCGSEKVSKVFSTWSHSHESLEDELKANREEFSALRKEKVNGNYLPVLWKP